MTLSLTNSGSTAKTQAFLKSLQSDSLYSGLASLAERGVSALRAATPMDSGLTAASWSYEIEIKDGTASVYWINTNAVDGVHVAILIQYSHGTGTGGLVQGRDYINPAIKPIMDEIANEIWKKVTSR